MAGGARTLRFLKSSAPLWSLCVSGCAAPFRNAAVQVPRAAVPVIVDESLRSFEEPENRARLMHIAGTPEMQQAIRETAQAAVEGVVANAHLTREQRAALVRDLDEAVASATGAALARATNEMPTTLGPALNESLSTALESPRLNRAIEQSTAGATRAALVTSRDVIEQMHDEENFGFFGRIRWLLFVGGGALFFLGAATSALAAWALQLRRRARTLAEARVS